MPERKFRNKLIDYLNPLAGEHILEFGFGTGANLIIAKQLSPETSFVGLDIDLKVLELAKRKLLNYQFEVDLKLYNGGPFPFETAAFDKVYSCLVFHHLDRETKIQCMNEIFRVIKPGGKLIIGDWGKSKSKLMRAAFYLVQMIDGTKTTNDNVNGLMLEYIEDAGFSNVSELGYINTKVGSFCYYEGFK